MPPRKSIPGGAATDPIPGGMSVEDLSLPRTMVQRLAKGMLPPNTQLGKEALLAMSKSATVFVNYLTSQANENAARANKKTIQPKDVFDAIKELEFEAFLPRLESELDKYNAIQCDKRNSYRRRIREEKKGTEGDSKDGTENAGGDETMLTEDGAAAKATASTGATTKTKTARDDDDQPPAAKKIRRSGADGMDTGSDDEDGPDEEEEEEGEGASEGDEDEEGEDEEEEADDSGDDDGAEEQLVEDLLEARDAQADDQGSSDDDDDDDDDSE